MIEIVSELIIDAPPEKVWAFFYDTNNWPKINDLLRDSSPGRPLEPGKERLVIINPPGLPPLKVVPKIIEHEKTALCWRGSVPGFWGEHYFRAEPAAGGKKTRWVHGERFGGFLSRPLLAIGRSRMEKAYSDFNYALAEALKS